ncbi:uncharacterized protein BT62DRAFT_938896 [Guyanagaster necrorhizus]|uniref:Uncharacterized protein n=1 Tax=Guyanagaster necrorhizus TaxID=856835 RepID=A0A9P7VFE2_9AGAR|nr:uncharacterized protein BT62DRAFT_938896 [Guyanagaster necrorhizus MCA 3950]KAG7439540.1 hypothetical protein BT62DRAFT_938896 [Guyanagaster necrorhizus MCA 3950]
MSGVYRKRLRLIQILFSLLTRVVSLLFGGMTKCLSKADERRAVFVGMECTAQRLSKAPGCMGRSCDGLIVGARY